MSLSFDLPFWANVSAVLGFLVTSLGAGVGTYGYFSYRRAWSKKADALVRYLRDKKETARGGEKGQHTVLHLIRHVGLTEDEILKISFENEQIGRVVDSGKSGKAETLFFEYIQK